MSDTRQHVHSMFDLLPPVQLAAVKTLLSSMLDGFPRRLVLAPMDDEPFTEEDRQAVAESEKWLRRNPPIPLEAVLPDFGLTMADWDRMAKEPPDATGRDQAHDLKNG